MSLRRAFITVVAGTAWVSGCAGGVSGEVDSDSVPRFTTSAAFEANSNFLNRDVIAATWSSSGDACRDGTALLKIYNNADNSEEYADDVEAYAKDNLAEDYWTASVVLNAQDIDDLKKQQDIDFNDQDSDLIGGLTICHITGYPKSTNGSLDTDEDCYSANEGVLRVQYQSEGTLSVSTDGDNLIEVDETDGNGDGHDLSFGGNAGYCADGSKEYDDQVNTLGGI